MIKHTDFLSCVVQHCNRSLNLQNGQSLAKTDLVVPPLSWVVG